MIIVLSKIKSPHYLEVALLGRCLLHLYVNARLPLIRTHITYPCFWWDRASNILPRNVVVLRCKPTPHLVKLVERQQQGRRGQRRSRGADGRCDGDLDSGEESIREMIVRAKERTLSIVTSRMPDSRGPRKACGRRSSC